MATDSVAAGATPLGAGPAAIVVPDKGLKRNAIGFLSNYQADKGGVHVVSVNGVTCNRSTVVSGQYQGVARFYEVTKGKATGAATAFIGWIIHSSAARKIISTQWVPVT